MGRTCSTVFKLTISKFTITLVNIPVVVFLCELMAAQKNNYSIHIALVRNNIINITRVCNAN